MYASQVGLLQLMCAYFCNIGLHRQGQNSRGNVLLQKANHLTRVGSGSETDVS